MNSQMEGENPIEIYLDFRPLLLGRQKKVRRLDMINNLIYFPCFPAHLPAFPSPVPRKDQKEYNVSILQSRPLENMILRMISTHGT